MGGNTLLSKWLVQNSWRLTSGTPPAQYFVISALRLELLHMVDRIIGFWAGIDHRDHLICHRGLVTQTSLQEEL